MLFKLRHPIVVEFRKGFFYLGNIFGGGLLILHWKRMNIDGQMKMKESSENGVVYEIEREAERE